MGQHVLDVGDAPSVNPTGASPGDYEQIQASPDAFGAGIGRAEQGLGSAVTQAGDTGMDILTARQQLTNEVHSSEVNTWLADKITDKFSAFSKLEGRAAQDALPQFKQDIQDLQKQAMAQAGNPNSAAMIARSTAPLVDGYYRYGTNHADQQFRTYQDRTATARAATYGGQGSIAASQGDFASMETAWQVSDDEVRKKYEQAGYDPDSMAREIALNRGRNVANAVEQVATIGVNGAGAPNLDVAKAIFDKHRNEMDQASQLRIEQYLAPRLLNRQAEALGAAYAFGGAADVPGGPLPGHGRGSINAAYTGAIDQPRVEGGPAPIDVYKHAISRGATRNEALVLMGGAANEGSFDPTALHDRDENGNPTGYGMFGHRLDRRDQMFREAGTSRPTWQQQTDFALKELKADPNNAALNAAVTPVDLTNAEMHFERPRAYQASDPMAGENYNGRLSTMRRFASLVGPEDADDGTGPRPTMDKSAAIQKAMTDLADNPVLRDKTIAVINRKYSQFNAATATERQAITLDFPNQLAAAEAGDESAQIPGDRIDALYPAPKAQAMKDQFAIAQHVGTVIKGIQFGSPEEVADAARDIESGQGQLSTLMKSHARFAATGPGANGAAPDDDMNGAYFRMRTAAAKRVQEIITQRSKMLMGPSSDPAAYVMAEPSVAKAAADMGKNPTDTNKLGAYVAATLGVQSHLGVPEDQQHVFTREQAIGIAQKLQTSGVDVRDQLAGLQKSFGSNYAKVFSDLVQLGKLPSSYQAVAALPDKDDANLLARALHEAPGTGEDGKKAESWTQRLALATGTSTAVGDIQKNLNADTDLQAYIQTLKRQGVSAPKIDAIQNDVTTLAFAKAYYLKMTPATAATDAVAAFTKHFNILPGGQARIPSAVYDAVIGDSDALVSGLSVSNVKLPPFVGGAGQPTAENYISDVQAHHEWINTQKGDGIMIVDNSGSHQGYIGKPILDKDGKPYVIHFNSAGTVSRTVRQSSEDFMGP